MRGASLWDVRARLSGEAKLPFKVLKPEQAPDRLTLIPSSAVSTNSGGILSLDTRGRVPRLDKPAQPEVTRVARLLRRRIHHRGFGSAVQYH